jgi:hypothetical protein
MVLDNQNPEGGFFTCRQIAKLLHSFTDDRFLCRTGAAMAWALVATVGRFQNHTSKTQNSNDGRDTSMMQIEEPKPLLSSFEILARQNRDSHLKAVLDQPEALKIPGLESLETMQSQIQELQAKYESRSCKTSHRASHIGGP